MSGNHQTRVLLFDQHRESGSLATILEESGLDVSTAASRVDAMAAVDNGGRPAAVILGDPEGADRISVVRELLRATPGLPVIVLGDDVEPREVVRTIRAGAVDFLPRKRASTDLADAVHEAVQGNGASSGGASSATAAPIGGADDELGDGELADGNATFVVGSAEMEKVRTLVAQVADTDVTVLITGESGSGKEIVARALHRGSSRRDAPFVKVNCAALPSQLLESELFGYERGAFTGAVRRKPGKFELADGGTIFLDEIGEIEQGLQAKLLQVLQDNAFSRLGGDREVSVDARILASTNRDLESAMNEGSFRKDLYFRLNVVRIEVPPLRDRREEIPLLVEHFLERYRRRYDRDIGPVSDEVLRELARHDWPGNVRELENLVRRMVVLEDVDGVVDALGRAKTERAVSGVDVESMIEERGQIPPLKEVSRLAALEVEGELIERALEKTGWNRREAAELLNISYKALLYKIRDCGLTPP